MSTTLSAKLKEKVCDYAHVSYSLLTASADEWLSKVVDEWIRTRSASDSQLRNAARELRGAFPRLPPRRSESALKRALRSERAEPHVALGNSRTSAAPLVATGAPPSHDLAGPPPPRSHTTDPPAHNNACAAPSPTLSASASQPPSTTGVRVQVLKRLQRLNADADYIRAFERERDAEAHEREARLEEKRRRQAAVHEEMERAEALRLQRVQQAREERQSQRKQVQAAVEETKLAEMDEKLYRQKKSREEREAIEAQTRLNRQLKEEEFQRQREEEARLRDFTLQRDRQQMLSEIERTSSSKMAMMSALEEGKTAIMQREALRRSQKDPVIVFETRGSDEDRRKIVRQREQLQSIACQQYAELQANRREQLAKMDHTALEQRLQQMNDAAERERRDRERAIQLRQNLVSSLDEEISHQRDRKQRDAEEKKKLRQQMDLEAAEAEVARKEKLLLRKLDQVERRRQMDEQLASRLEQMIQPMTVKI